MISFENTEHAFAYKPTRELKKAHFLFRIMNKALLVRMGLALTPVAIKLKIPFTKKLIRTTIFGQFVGGETLGETAAVANKLSEYNVKTILDYGVEGGDDGDAGFDHAAEEFVKVIDYAGTQQNIPFMSIKVTGIARFALLQKLDEEMHKLDGTLMKNYFNAIENLGENEKQEWQKVLSRFTRICETANRKNVGVLVDAEETWIQDPVDAITMLMMDTYNKNKAVVFNTLQLYRHDRLEFLKKSFEAAEERNFILGAKLVRGAYMEKERNRAEKLNYPSPIQPDKTSCDRDYNDAVAYCINHIDRIFLIVASHNEHSNLYATQLLDEKSFPHLHPHIHFSQLFGMSDNITFNLARNACSVSKYLPFGPIEDVIPYLMRRAEENSSMSGQTSRELLLIEKELKRRKSAQNNF